MVNQPLCSYCSKPLSGRYFRDYWGNSYHAGHLKTVPSCDYCGRLISKNLTQGGKAYADGRKICGLCSATAVNDTAKGKEILQIIHDQLETAGIVISPFKPEFYLIDRLKLKNMSGNSEKQGFARFERLSVGGKIESYKLRIYILKGLPESSFITAAAHELMHIWFYSQSITDLKPALEEGSCNYASYILLKKINSPEALYRIREMFADKNPVYGKGFRRIHKMVDSRGIMYWFNYIKTHKR